MLGPAALSTMVNEAMSQNPYEAPPPPNLAAAVPAAGSGVATPEPAPLGVRTGAAVIDVIVIIAGLIVITSIFGETTTTNGGVESEVGPTGSWVFLLFALLYHLVPEALYGKTLGKLLLGLRVVDTAGNRLRFGPALGRNLLRAVDGLPIFYLVGFIAAAATKQRQRIGDMAANTLVIRG